MPFEHIHQVKKLISRPKLRQLMKRTDRHAWMYLLRHFAIIFATGYLVYLCIDTWLFIPSMFIHGIGIVHLFSPQHEFAHRTAFRTRWLNDFFGWIFGVAIMLPNVYFRWEHTAHHSFTQQERRDPQLIRAPRTVFEYVFYLSSLPYWWGFLRAFVRHLFAVVSAEEKRFLPKTERWKVVAEAWAMLAIYLAVVFYVIVTDSMAPLYYWLIPRVLAEPYMRFVRMTEHVGRPVNNSNLLENTRTTTVGPLARALAWNMPFHAEHHLSPAVPFHALPDFCDEINQHHIKASNGYLDAHLDIVRTCLTDESPA